ncbi:hypothetical protein BDZ85DRAFT_130134 [Elsinoe ampelina]|uniref:Uncharacterized protein n=1 Tax=Elsinoe ampelina TaxID=302913 RepID=A0A6A6GAH8_9PEZI|nr:hypothetical protein BDZ85DRAFT_130134 [Elsinoe ampelina]
MHASGRPYLSQLWCPAIALPFDYCITAPQSEMHHRTGVDTIAFPVKEKYNPTVLCLESFLRHLLFSSVCTRQFAGIKDMASLDAGRARDLHG